MIQNLVSNGHLYCDVLDMAFYDFLAFSKVINHRRNEHYKMLSGCVRMAGADKKDWEAWIETD